MEILRYIKLPRGTLLEDNRTYRLEKKDFPRRKFKYELELFDKILVLSDGNGRVVGGVLFYNWYDIQALTFPKYRGRGYMSAIHKNGILKSECYEGQQVTLVPEEIKSMDDFMMRYHLLKCAGLKPRNLQAVWNALYLNAGTEGLDEEKFLKKYA